MTMKRALNLRQEVFLKDGEPGESFLTTQGSRWAIWKILDGSELDDARELGYRSAHVAACVLVSDDSGFPYNPQTDANEPRHGMTDAARPELNTQPMQYLGEL